MFRYLFCMFIFFYGIRAIAADSLLIVREVNISGNIRTKEAIILREMSLKSGQKIEAALLSSELELNKKRILNLHLFVTVSVRAENIGNQTIDVYVELKERIYLIALPVFYLADRNFNEWWYDRNHDFRRTIYGLYASYSNVTGNNDKIKVRAEFGFIPNFEIAYSSPYLDKKLTTTLTLGAYYGINKTLAYRTWEDKFQFFSSDKAQREKMYFYGSLMRRKGFYQTQSLDLLYNDTKINDTIARLNPNYFLEGKVSQKYWTINYSYVLDRRDQRQYALKGYRFLGQVTQLGLPGDDINQAMVQGAWSQYFHIFHKFYGNYTLRGKYSSPSVQPFFQTQGLGYRNDLVRGYELYVIDGQHFGLTKTNLKYQLFDKIFDLSRFIKVKKVSTFPLAVYINSFVDVGYVKNKFASNNNSALANNWLVGTGLGLDFVTWYNFVGRINYSFNKLGEHKLFFNFAREF